MTNVIFIIVMQKGYVFENFIVRRNSITRYKRLMHLFGHDDGIGIQKPTKQKVKLLMNGILLYYFVHELCVSSLYRHIFMNNFSAHTNSNINAIKLLLVPADKEILDYSWNCRTTYLVRERCELEHTLSWLSTLGGAFSALGDYFANCAETAGKISLNQLQLAFRLGDPTIVSRCRLYLSLSLIQRNQFKLARRIIYNEYIKTKNNTVVDIKLVNMCKGIWCKLKYEYQLYRKNQLVS